MDKEIEQLKAENATYKANADVVQKYITQNEQLKTHIDGLEKKDAELKAENERLKEELNVALREENLLKSIFNNYRGVCRKQYQTLQEIKEIVEENHFYFEPGTIVSYETIKQIATNFEKIIKLITKAGVSE